MRFKLNKKNTDNQEAYGNSGLKAKTLTFPFNQYINLLPARNDLHISRKIWHVSTGLALLYFLFIQTDRFLILSVLGLLTVLSCFVEFTRLRNPRVNEFCVRAFGMIIRTSEVHSVSGMPYYAASCFLALSIFPEKVAVLSILYLTFGDPIASFVGILSKKKAIPILKGKSFQGTAAAFLTCALLTWLYLKSTTLFSLDLIRMTLLGGFAGAVAELLPLEIDDNFTIPMVSGFIMWLGLILLHFV